ncbi:MAG: anti-sigma factor RsbA family regulatory protein [Solirubrobacteraceae bacterium]
MTGDPATAPPNGRTFVHEALLYRGRGELERSVRDFMREAADAGEPVLAALPRTSLEWLRDVVGGGPTEVRFEDMSEIGRNPSRLLPLYQDWITDRSGHGHVISEPMWPGRSYAETAECLRHEALLNVALASSGARILCPYDAANLEPEVLVGAELTHPHVRDASGSRPSERFADPIELSRGDNWPQQPPAHPVSEHRFGGDLRSLRRTIVNDPCLGGLSRERRDDVVFVINEAATNVVKHADGTCTTRLWNDGLTVVAEVSSGSALPDVLAGRRRPAPEAPAGRGLWLINQVCDLVELRSGDAGTTLRMHLRDAA